MDGIKYGLIHGVGLCLDVTVGLNADLFLVQLIKMNMYKKSIWSRSWHRSGNRSKAWSYSWCWSGSWSGSRCVSECGHW